MTPREYAEQMDALAIHADLIAHSGLEVMRIADVLGLETLGGSLRVASFRTFQLLAEECRKKAASFRESE